MSQLIGSQIGSLLACGAAAVLLANLAAPAAALPPYQVKKIEGVRYFDGAAADAAYHRLDLYLPEGKKDFPVVFYVHGGGWTIGHRNQLGTPERLGAAFARGGIALVSIDYRLSPAVKHPEHVRDVARAFGWTHRNIAKYGGRPDELFVCGHSAGGHLIALLATNGRFLKEQGLSPRAIRGAMPISGVFCITKDKFFTGIFGDSPDALRDASPLHNVGPETPPFLIIHAETEFPHCGRPYAAAFLKELQAKNVPAQLLEMKGRNHLTVLWHATRAEDRAHQAMRSFIAAQVVLHRLSAGDATALAALDDFLCAP